MAFRFRRRETTGDGLRRIWREQTGDVVSLLADEAENLSERIHNARRGLKRLRAALHLVEGEMDDAAFEVRDTHLRAAGRKLASSRDATVALETFEKLAPELEKKVAAGIRAHLAAAATKTRLRTTSARQLARLAAEVRACGRALTPTSLRRDGWKLIEPGIARTYRVARKMRRTLRVTPKPEIVHEWRRLVKRLFYQVELLRRALPKSRRKLLPRLESLDELLGEFNDLHLLRAAVAPPCPALDALIKRELARRLKRSRRIARDVFRKGAKQFTTGLRVSWRKWTRA